MTTVISLINQLSRKRKNANNSQWAKEKRIKQLKNGKTQTPGKSQ